MGGVSVERARRSPGRDFWLLAISGGVVVGALALLVGGHATGLDTSLAAATADLRSPTLESLGLLTAAITRPAALTALVVGLCMVLVARRSWVDAGVLLGATLVSDALAVVGKVMVDRPRPTAPINLAPEAEASFPSGHVVTAATVAFVLVLIFWPQLSRRARVWALVVASGFTTLVSVDRLVVGAHWLTDVIAALGAAAMIIGLAGVVLSRSRRVS